MIWMKVLSTPCAAIQSMSSACPSLNRLGVAEGAPREGHQEVALRLRLLLQVSFVHLCGHLQHVLWLSTQWYFKIGQTRFTNGIFHPKVFRECRCECCSFERAQKCALISFRIPGTMERIVLSPWGDVNVQFTPRRHACGGKRTMLSQSPGSQEQVPRHEAKRCGIHGPECA